MKKQLLFLLPVLMFVLFSCKKKNQDDIIPGYVYVPNFEINIDSSKEGTKSQKISDVWVSTSTSSLGGYELPARIPILANGATRLYFFAGIKENGISVTRFPYPFFKPIDTTLNLIAGKIDTFKPKIEYKPQTRFAWLENFDGTQPSVILDNKSSAKFKITNNPDSVYSGFASLEAVLTDSANYFECKSEKLFSLPRNQAVWLELNYYTDVPIIIGVYAWSNLQVKQKVVSGLNPINRWNKIYINLTTAVTEEPGGTRFSIYFSSYKSKAGADKKLLLDNIKLLYLE